MLYYTSNNSYLRENAERNGEKFKAITVLLRDGWRCQLCGKKLNPKHRGTYRDDAPELDHVTPLSKGGEHSKRNTQCACRKCNLSKSNKALGQLRLFG
jgi:5-methylcytosine-specific restriction endonuclease McrA